MAPKDPQTGVELPFTESEWVDDLFDAFDLDASGGLSRREVRLAIEACGVPLSSDRFLRLFDHIDPDAKYAALLVAL